MFTTLHKASCLHRTIALTSLLAFAVAGWGVSLHAQSSGLRAEATCVEYYTAPLTDATGETVTTGSVGNTQEPPFIAGAVGDLHTKGYIAHFATYSSDYQSYYDQRGVSGYNFFFPGPATYSVQPSTFVPGYSESFRLLVPYFAVTWFLGPSSAVLTPVGIPTGNGPDSNVQSFQSSPTCPPQFVPATNLSFSSPGTYTHQYLGQVNSGPPANPATTLSVLAMSGSPKVSIANVTYVPNDSANPINDPNPNSIYGDVTIGAVGNQTNIAKLLLSINGAQVMSGMVPITYTGELTLPDSTTTLLGSTYNPAPVNVSTTLQATVMDVTQTNEMPSGNVIFRDTFNGVTTALATVPLSSGQATLNYEPDSRGDHAITAIYNPADVTLYSSSNVAQLVTITDPQPSIRFSIPDQTYGNVPFPVLAYSNSHGAITYKVDSGPATILNSTVTINGVGNVVIEADQVAVPGSFYSNMKTAPFSIAKAPAAVTLQGLTQTYTGTPLPVTSTTTPTALAVTYTYNGSSASPSAVGSYTVVGTVNDADYQGSASGTLIIAPIVPGTVLLTTSTVLTNISGRYQATITVTNAGTGTAQNVQLTAAALGVAAGTPAPVALGAIAPKGSASTVLTFPSTAGAHAAMVVEKLTGSYTGGSLSVSARAVLP